jgi:antitoxin VapB
MKTAKVFKSGNSQAVRIPKEFHLEGEEVEIQKRGGSLVLRPKKKSWAALIESLKKFSDDFMEEGRVQPPAQDRGRAFP